MKIHLDTVGGEPVKIYVVNREEDLDEFRRWISEQHTVAFDTETTGLNIYSSGTRIRTAQFGNRNVGWVVPVERGGNYHAAVVDALRSGFRRVLIHNASFDIGVADEYLGGGGSSLWPVVTDTRILSHLADPRGVQDGGVGHSLEGLTREHVDPGVAERVKGSMTQMAKSMRCKKDEVWEMVDFDNPIFQLYAGFDPILTYRIWEALPNHRLLRYEMELARVCYEMERNGFLLDQQYTAELDQHLWEEQMLLEHKLMEWGGLYFNVNSTDDIAEVLLELGYTIPEVTKLGKPKVDKDLLEKLAPECEFAETVIECKKAGKWRTTWVQNFLSGVDSAGRCHAHINTLQARTARMSITGIPAQTLPANDSLIRRCFVADPGQRILSVDYQAQELRVLAGLSKDRTMMQAFREGADLHQMTADAAFGAGANKTQRAHAKTVNFGRVYGGGVATVAKQTGLDPQTARSVIQAFDQKYPGVKNLSNRLQREALHSGHVSTPSGRRLPVDREKPYAALNYLIQSTSRDVTGAALLRLDEAGWTPYMRLPIHDELVLSVPQENAEYAGREVAKIMATEVGGVELPCDYEVGKRSWGSLYGSEE